jgi:non-specific protein-tyrosine kinase
MSRIRNKLNQIQALRNINQKDTRESELSEREQLELDICELLSEEHPDILESKKKNIKLSYSTTKTIQVDSEFLRCNHVFAHIPDILITEQIEIFRTQVLKKLKQMNANSLMIASAGHQEGKTFVSANLAVSIAQHLDHTVLLIDADLRNRSYAQHDIAHLFFNSKTELGLSDYLNGEADIENLLLNPGIPRLTILPSGRSLPDSDVFLGSPKMKKLVCEMKARYSTERIIIFDSSTFLSNADSLILSKHVDAVLLVVENEKTEKKALLRTIEMLEDKNKIIGTVMNKAR